MKKWIRRYVVTEYLLIYLFLGVALKWQDILQLSLERSLSIGLCF